jgi:hypothetical protein
LLIKVHNKIWHKSQKTHATTFTVHTEAITADFELISHIYN